MKKYIDICAFLFVVFSLLATTHPLQASTKNQESSRVSVIISETGETAKNESETDLSDLDAKNKQSYERVFDGQAMSVHTGELSELLDRSQGKNVSFNRTYQFDSTSAVSASRTREQEGQIVPNGLKRIQGEAIDSDDLAPVRVAVLDSGIAEEKHDLQVALKGAINVVNDHYPGRVEDDIGHGTAVSSLIAAEDNDIGIRGVAGNVDLYMVKVFDDRPRIDGTDDENVLAGLEWVLNESAHPPIDIINLSFGDRVPITKNSHLKRALQKVRAQGITVISSAGDEGQSLVDKDDGEMYVPAAYSETIAVSALTDTDGRPGGNGRTWTHPNFPKVPLSAPDDSFFPQSNTGQEVDFIAPGTYQHVLLPDIEHPYPVNGTDFAAPLVTGTVALLMGQTKKENQSLSQEQIKEILRKTGTVPESGWTNDRDETTEPLINIRKAMNR